MGLPAVVALVVGGAAMLSVATYVRRLARLRARIDRDRKEIADIRAVRLALLERLLSALADAAPASTPAQRALAGVVHAGAPDEEAVQSALTDCLVEMELTPALRSHPPVAAADSELAIVENRLAFLRQLHDDGARRYNGSLARGPFARLGRALGHRPVPLLDREPPPAQVLAAHPVHPVSR